MPMAQPRSPQSPEIITQDSLWLISVAESPDNNQIFFFYVRTPTQNRVLVRERSEIAALDSKLKKAHPELSLPLLSLDPSLVSSCDEPKPKPSIRDLFNVLFQFSPPEPNGRLPDNDYFSSSTPTLTRDLIATDESSEATASESVSVASYFTALSKEADIRESKAWKEFMKVRQDDVESGRLSDTEKLAKHGQAGRKASNDPSDISLESLKV